MFSPLHNEEIMYNQLRHRPFHRVFYVLLLGLLIVPTAGCRRTTSELPAQNILLITLDTVRADRIGAWGQEAAGTPWLDGVAAGGVRIERAYAQVPITLPSHMSIFTGLQPGRTGVHDNGVTATLDGVRTLAEILKGHGFLTAAAVGGFPVTSSFPVARGFDIFDDRLVDRFNPSALERSAEGVLSAATALTESLRGERTFLWVHLFDAHDPYRPPPPFDSGFKDAYQGEIAYMDAALKRFVARLPGYEDNRWLVCIAGDHGESLGEHGEPTHGFFLYEPTVRIPLLFAGPRVPRGVVLPGPAQTVDITPTLLTLLDLPVPAGLDGRAIDFRNTDTMEATVYLETELPQRHFGWSPLRGVINGWHKYIESPNPEFYDLRDDPEEALNSFHERGDEAAFLAAALPATGPLGSSTTPAATPDPRLMSLGYVGTVGRGAGIESPRDPKANIRIYRAFVMASMALEQEPPDPGRALELLDGLRGDERTSAVMFKQALAYRMAGDLEEAFRILDRIALQDPEYSGIHLERARSAIATGRASLAGREAGKHLAAFPEDVEALLIRGAAAEHKGALSAAESDYRAALALNPAYRNASLRLAALLVRAERMNEAASQLTGHLQYHPNDELAAGLLSELRNGQ